jgi:GTP cyclohydrolase I
MKKNNENNTDDESVNIHNKSVKYFAEKCKEKGITLDKELYTVLGKCGNKSQWPMKQPPNPSPEHKYIFVYWITNLLARISIMPGNEVSSLWEKTKDNLERKNGRPCNEGYLYDISFKPVWRWENRWDLLKCKNIKDDDKILVKNLKFQLKCIGEDPNREGLQKTPERIIKSWEELYAGYWEDPADLLTVFETGTYDQIVVCKDIELYSMCEHHMLPFFGVVHVAYLPDKYLIGLSKLARLVDIFARRLQIQERIGEQVTQALMKYLKPRGAACIIEAVHMCMRMRGCSKQNSTMITSSMKGTFLYDESAKQELMTLIKR